MISKHLEEIKMLWVHYQKDTETCYLWGIIMYIVQHEASMIDFSQVYRMTNLIKSNTCCENPEKPTCIRF